MNTIRVGRRMSDGAPVTVPAPRRANLKALKARLTRAKNSGDPLQVIDACNAAARAFDAHGWPDCWPMWNIARQDALLAAKDRAHNGDDRCFAAVCANIHNPFN